MISAAEEALLIERANACIEGKSRSYTDDALVFARVIEELFGSNKALRDENKALNDNVTALQVVGTNLVKENRRLKGIEDT